MSTISASARLDHLLSKEKRSGAASWVGDAIYGVNDGLGAIFGIIAGVAGYTPNSHTILVSGLFGAIASTLSMGAGAWLATKSENELLETGLRQAEKDVLNHPEKELEILSLIYETKGLSEEDSRRIARAMASDKEQFVQLMAQEKHGIHESSRGNPWSSGVFGAISTFAGAIVPLIPFFFLHGQIALVAAAVVSLVAHFAVGALKSMVTVRSWIASGFEMTLAGVVVGVGSYVLGILGGSLLG